MWSPLWNAERTLLWYIFHMPKNRLTRQQWTLLAGDIATLVIVTIIGFASHNRLSDAAARFLPNLIPWIVAWLLVGPHLGVFDTKLAAQPRQLWRPPWAMLLAAPMGGLLRSLWLGTQVIPLFVLVMGSISALALLLWRFVYLKMGSSNHDQ